MTKSAFSSHIEAQARRILHEAGIVAVPIPIEKLAFRIGLNVEAVDLGDEVSGVLILNNGTGTIGYNWAHPHVRQRFTIAHEIGHYVLHQADDQLFIDRQYTAVFRRDQDSSSGEHRREIEANRFAAALLMPENLVLKEISRLDFDLGDERALTDLASKFQVSTQAMSLRLSNMGIFTDTED
jgi:Zn-dependent peptidase ImmA (M78 family)